MYNKNELRELTESEALRENIKDGARIILQALYAKPTRTRNYNGGEEARYEKMWHLFYETLYGITRGSLVHGGISLITYCNIKPNEPNSLTEMVKADPFVLIPMLALPFVTNIISGVIETRRYLHDQRKIRENDNATLAKKLVDIAPDEGCGPPPGM